MRRDPVAASLLLLLLLLASSRGKLIERQILHSISDRVSKKIDSRFLEIRANVVKLNLIQIVGVSVWCGTIDR